jgi:hypothetical protein
MPAVNPAQPVPKMMTFSIFSVIRRLLLYLVFLKVKVDFGLRGGRGNVFPSLVEYELDRQPLPFGRVSQ